MHIDWSIRVSDVALFIGMIGGILHVRELITLMRIEHEMLISWYCKETDTKREDLPTRIKFRLG